LNQKGENMAEAKKEATKESKEEAKPIKETTKKVTKAVSTAKAGKRSAKALKEKAQLEKKQTKKAEKATEDLKPEFKVITTTRTRLERRAKGYRKSAELIDINKQYELKEALELATKTSHVKFDASVELHVRLNVDPKQADQNLRDTVVMPAGTGKDIKIAVFAEADQVAAAKKAGADIAGSEEFLQQLDKNQLNFDVLISTPQMMPKLGKYARVLGPKGLMPNPKSGTVTGDIQKAVKEAKAGKVEYRVDSAGIVHVAIGKVSFGTDNLIKNATAILSSLKSNKPTGLKSNYVKSVYITTSMGPAIKLVESVV
jgi:ribosomal protein L1